MQPRRGLEAGDAVGPYLLLHPLGEGGMGQVWAASRHDRVHALKLLIGEEFTSERALLFTDEARAASALAHESIVPTVDFGRDGSIHWLAMRMVRGPSLKDLVDVLQPIRRPIAPLAVAYLGVRLASALHYAHSSAALDGRRLRLVHRDVSPHNVLLDRDGGVYLTDFGVARTSVQVHLTTAGTVRGKPSYMAPEQVAGRAIDHRTDIFALGTTLYEAASTHRLFDGKRPADKMKAVLTVKPKPLTSIVSNFPPALWKVIEQALEKNPDDRFGSAAHVHQRLSALVQVNGGMSKARELLATLVRRVYVEPTEKVRSLGFRAGDSTEPTYRELERTAF
jgi:eukaryotic-like serine/threonine-protein kinase